MSLRSVGSVVLTAHSASGLAGLPDARPDVLRSPPAFHHAATATLPARPLTARASNSVAVPMLHLPATLVATAHSLHTAPAVQPVVTRCRSHTPGTTPPLL